MNNSKVKFYIKEYFTFSSGEKVGILVLISLMLVVIIAIWALSHIKPDSPVMDTSKFDKEIMMFEKSQDSLRVKSADQHNAKFSERKVAPVGTKSFTMVELNKADSASLEALPGIGPVFSKRILKYRSILGGYHNLNQLYEVYGMQPETVEKIKGLVKIDTTLIRKIDINEALFKEINAHPYISFEQTKAICKFRSRNKILSIIQLMDQQIFSAEDAAKLRPYLLFKK